MGPERAGASRGRLETDSSSSTDRSSGIPISNKRVRGDAIDDVPGEILWTDEVPLELGLVVKDVGDEKSMRVQVGRFGRLRTTWESYAKRGFSVGVRLGGPNFIRMYIAEHPDLIKAPHIPRKRAISAIGAATATTAAVGAAIYMIRHHRSAK